MERLIVVARLKDGTHQEAELLLAQGPPFEPADLKLHRHAAYLTAGEVVFVFEAPEVEWIVNDVLDGPLVVAAFEPWRDLVDGPPRIAHERFFWSREQERSGIGLGL